jgi:hypothetical protein
MKLGYGDLPPDVWIDLADGVELEDVQEYLDKEGNHL